MIVEELLFSQVVVGSLVAPQKVPDRGSARFEGRDSENRQKCFVLLFCESLSCFFEFRPSESSKRLVKGAFFANQEIAGFCRLSLPLPDFF